MTSFFFSGHISSYMIEIMQGKVKLKQYILKNHWVHDGYNPSTGNFTPPRHLTLLLMCTKVRICPTTNFSYESYLSFCIFHVKHTTFLSFPIKCKVFSSIMFCCSSSFQSMENQDIKVYVNIRKYI